MNGGPQARPILIVGAGRSGTNLLAMALGALPGLHNAYEQRYVWTKGASPFASDIRGSTDCTPANAAWIRAHFARIGAGQRVVDKTPSNALRLGFCRAVFPAAQIISVVRDPYDNIASRLRELGKIGHTATPEADVPAAAARGRVAILTDRIAHARRIVARGNVPLGLIPYAGLDQQTETARIAVSGRGQRWGERVPGMADISRAHGTAAALTHQWLACRTQVDLASADMDADSILTIRYEDMVQVPGTTATRVAEFLGLPDATDLDTYLRANARADTVGQAAARMTPTQHAAITAYLRASGYTAAGQQA